MTGSQANERGPTVCAVVGHPIAHSLSPVIHNAAFRAVGLDAVYVAFDVIDLAPLMTGLRAIENLKGLSITIPHKIDIVGHLDEMDPTAARIGSVNTVTVRGKRLYGSNTDGRGAVRALLDAGVELAGQHILLLGAGGAARAIAFTLAMECRIAGLTLADVDAKRAAALAAEVSRGTGVAAAAVGADPAALRRAIRASSVLIHCTPVGMWPRTAECVVPQDDLRPGLAVMDIVYNPLETELLLRARAAGCVTVPGVEMFLNQAGLQFREWTGLEPPLSVMRDALLSRLGAAPRLGGSPGRPT